MAIDPPDGDEPESPEREEADEVGYRKPPKHTRFRKGQSGNPRGRRKGSRGIKTDLHAELSTSQTIHINGKPEKGTRQQLMIRTLAARAATGEVKAAHLLVPLIVQVFGFEDRGMGADRLSAQDEKLLAVLLGERGTASDELPNGEDEAP